MNINSKDVVKNVESKNVESTSNEQRQTVKPIVISRRRLLRAGVAGIPVVLTMAGLAPGQGLKDKWSAASGLVYSGTGRGVRARFDDTKMVSDDNLVWSNENGFVYDKETKTLFTHPINETLGSITSLSPTSITISDTDTDNPEPSKTVSVTANSLSFDTLSLIAYLHKTGACYTDLMVHNTNSSQTIDAYFEARPITDFLTFTVDGGTLAASDLSVTPDDKITVTISDSDPVTGADGKAYYPLSDSFEIKIEYSANVAINNYESGSKTFKGSDTVSFSFIINIPSLEYTNDSDWQS